MENEFGQEMELKLAMVGRVTFADLCEGLHCLMIVKM